MLHSPKRGWNRRRRRVWERLKGTLDATSQAAGQTYAESDEFQHLRALHEDILKGYRARRFSAARQMAADAALLAPADIRGLYHYYQKHFEALDQHELPDTWAPMIALDEK